MAARGSQRPFPAALYFLLCPVEAYFNPTPPEAAILLGVRFSPFREVTPIPAALLTWVAMLFLL